MDKAGLLSGVLLAGGQSRRMGQDKAALLFEGEPLAARVARRLAAVCDEVLVASGDGRRLGWLGLPQVADARAGPGPLAGARPLAEADAGAGAGPLAGIVAGLAAARHPLVAVVGVDMPFVSASVLQELAGSWEGEPAVVARIGGRLEPLHAIYARAAGPALGRLLEQGERSVHRALETLGARVIPGEALAGADPEGRFALNLNRPQDLLRA